MASPKSYRLSRLAEADLDDIYAYTVKTWSGAQADIYYDLIIAAFEGLVSGVKIGHAAAVDGYMSTRVGSHSIFYREIDNVFYIARILHQAMDVERHLEQ